MTLILSDKLRNVLRGMHGDIAYYLTYRDGTTRADEVNHLDLRDDGMVTFRPVHRPHILNPDGSWAVTGRMAAKPGRIVRRVLHPEARIADAAIEQFANDIAAWSQAVSHPLRVVREGEIIEWYHGRRYHTSVNIGGLGESCMRYRQCEPYLALYAENPAVCGMLIATMPDTDRHNEDRLIGRALLWETDAGPYLDRIYGSDVTIARFRAHAAANDWAVYPYAPGDVALTSWRFDAYPYMDTYRHLDMDIGVLVADADGDDDTWTHVLESQHGDIGARSWYCPTCGHWTRERPVVGRCRECAGRARCDQCGDWFDEDTLGPIPDDAPLAAFYPDTYCRVCVTRLAGRAICPRCDNETDRQDIAPDEDGTVACQLCRGRARCSACDTWTPRAHIDTDGRCGYCQPQSPCPRCGVWCMADARTGDRCLYCLRSARCPCEQWVARHRQTCARCGRPAVCECADDARMIGARCSGCGRARAGVGQTVATGADFDAIGYAIQWDGSEAIAHAP